MEPIVAEAVQAVAEPVILTVACSVNWNIIIPTIVSALSALGFGWIALQNNRIKAQNDALTVANEEIHTAVNSTATQLAGDKAAQTELIKSLVSQVATLTESARGKETAAAVVAAAQEKK